MLFETTITKGYYNKHFYINCGLFLISFISLSGHFGFLVFNENLTNPFYPPYNDPNRLAWDFFCFGSMQSTIMVVFYSFLKMLYLLTFSRGLKGINNFNLRNFINIALIIAMLFYYLTLLTDKMPSNDPQTKFYYINYGVSTHIQHAVLPFYMLIYSFIYPEKNINFKRFMKRNYFFYGLYVMFYILVVSVRGHVLYLIDRKRGLQSGLWYYPYFFFNIHGTFPKGGGVIFIGAFMVFMLVFFLLGCLLIGINNLCGNVLKKKNVVLNIVDNDLKFDEEPDVIKK